MTIFRNTLSELINESELIACVDIPWGGDGSATFRTHFVPGEQAAIAGERILRHAAWYLMFVAWDMNEDWETVHRAKIGEAVDLLFRLAGQCMGLDYGPPVIHHGQR